MSATGNKASQAMDIIIETPQTDRKPIEKALYTLWSEMMGYEWIANEAAQELETLRARVTELEGMIAERYRYDHRAEALT